MARVTDHDTRDAEHASRMEIAVVVGPYIRRMNEMAKAYIQEAIEEATKGEQSVDGTAIGRAAALRAAAAYFTLADKPREIIEGTAASAAISETDS